MQQAESLHARIAVLEYYLTCASDTYLDEIRGLSGQRYAEVEPWAWARLMQVVRPLQRELQELEDMVA